MKTTLTMYGPNHEPVGFVFTLGDTPWPEPVIVTGLHVREDYRGKGHGTALMKALCTQADRQMKDLVLSVQPDPEIDFNRLVTFYQRFDFAMLEDGTTMRRKYHYIPRVDSGN
jgi:GNAT superfamily N-acetyltransferase